MAPFPDDVVDTLKPTLHEVCSLEEFLPLCLWQGVKRIAHVNQFCSCTSLAFQGFLLFSSHG